MADLVLISAGALVVVAVAVDALVTTLASASGAGPLTRRLVDTVWRLLLRLHRQDRPSSWLSVGGAGILALTVGTWVVLLWLAWTLVFLGSGAVVTSTNRAPAGGWDVAYFSGMTVVTLGTGDFVASGSAWRVVMALAALTGLFLLTLAITYLLNVISADVSRRALAMQVHALGGTPAELVRRGWQGEGFSDMYQQQLVNLLPEVTRTAEQHLAYPVLQYFHTRSKEASAPVAVAILDEAMLLVSAGVAAGHRPDPSVVLPLRTAVERYLTAVTDTAWTPASGSPPPPDLDALGEAGLPLAPRREFTDAVREVDDRRTRLHRIVVGVGWSWPAG